MSRRALVALVAIGLTLGVALGLSSERLVGVMPANAMAVFAGDAVDADRWPQSNFSDQDILDSRLIGRVGDTDVFAVRSAIDLSTRVRAAEPVVCVVASSPTLEYWFPANCVAESVFRRQGLRGVLTGNARGDFEAYSADFFRTDRLLTVVWHPSGTLEIADVTGDVVVSPDDLYTDAERALGLDLPIISSLRYSPAEPEIEDYLSEFVPVAEMGPAGIGGGSSQGDNVESFLSLHPPVEPDDGRTVCLTVRVNGELFPPACDSMEVFRADGVVLSVPSSRGGLLTLSASSGGLTFDSSRNISE